jgi:hypothetical protein
VGNPEGGRGAGAVRTKVARRPNIGASLVDEVGYETQTRAGEGERVRFGFGSPLHWR